MRLDKFLANMGLGSRTDVKKLLKQSAVTVNGVAIKDGAFQFDPETDTVVAAGRTLTYQEHYYYMLNKPAGVITASRDKNASTVLDLILPEDRVKGLSAVGRLDKDTVGMLIITDDGDLNHRLTSPKSHVDKTYLAILDKPITESEMQEMEKGIDIGDEDPTLPCHVEKGTEENSYLITIHEGRYHQVKRMFAHYGAEVIYLKRLSMGKLQLDENLEEGAYKALTTDELELLE